MLRQFIFHKLQLLLEGTTAAFSVIHSTKDFGNISAVLRNGIFHNGTINRGNSHLEILNMKHENVCTNLEMGLQIPEPLVPL